MASVNTYDTIVLDWMLPARDGVAVCRSLRASGLEAPILELTARDGIEDHVLGLNGGTDGYRLGPPSR
jgi:DNA-binding response OmpR family regulator